MCLAIPLKVEAILDHEQALVTLNGIQTEISVALIEDLRVGDYVIVHVGYALSKLDPEEAAKTLSLINDGNTDSPHEA